MYALSTHLSIFLPATWKIQATQHPCVHPLSRIWRSIYISVLFSFLATFRACLVYFLHTIDHSIIPSVTPNVPSIYPVVVVTEFISWWSCGSWSILSRMIALDMIYLVRSCAWRQGLIIRVEVLRAGGLAAMEWPRHPREANVKK